MSEKLSKEVLEAKMYIQEAIKEQIAENKVRKVKSNKDNTAILITSKEDPDYDWFKDG